MVLKAILVALALTFIGCSTNCGDNYNKLRAKCKRLCRHKQNDNVGSTFMFRDIHATFGKCKCFGEDGNRIDFYISVEED